MLRGHFPRADVRFFRPDGHFSFFGGSGNNSAGMDQIRTFSAVYQDFSITESGLLRHDQDFPSRRLGCRGGGYEPRHAVKGVNPGTVSDV